MLTQLNGQYITGVMSYGTLKVASLQIKADNIKGDAVGIIGYENMICEVQDTNINANSNEASAWGIENNSGAKTSVTNINVFADATSFDGANASVGIMNGGELKFYSGSVYGVHSGITNSANAKLYVYGGTFDGYGHGGIYFAQGENGEAYVENATLKSGEYKGKHDESKFSLAHGGSFYIGGGTAANNSNNKVYMNGCTITSVSGTMGVLRGSDGETNNQLYISNSTIESGKKMRIDENQKLFVGKGTNITEANVSSVDRVEFTNEEYKR